MAARSKTLILATPLLLPPLVSGFAQAAGSPPAPTQPGGGVGEWITGHPVTDFFVALGIVVVIAGAYTMRRRSRA